MKLSPAGWTLVFGRDGRTELPGIRSFLAEIRPDERNDSCPGTRRTRYTRH